MTKCKRCSKPATLHITEIRSGAVQELHLCETCAQQYLNQEQDETSESAEEVAQLSAAYLLLRKAENALQMMRDQQVHRLPVASQDRARLCIALGVAEWPEALERIERAREVVANRFASWLFAAADPGAAGGW